MAFTDNFKGKKGLIFLGGGGLAVVGLLYWRHRNAAAAASPATDATAADTTGTDTGGGYDPNAIDPATGLTYAEEAGQSGFGDFGFGGAGGFFPAPITGDGGTGLGPGSFTNNAQWAQYAEQQLSGVGNDSALSAAIGKYLTGQPMTADQKGLVDQAIAIAGYPPVSGPGGFPPSMHTTSGGGGGQGGGGGGGRQQVFITAEGHKDLFQTAASHGLTENRLVQLNPGLRHFEGTKKKIPRGTRIRIK